MNLGTGLCLGARGDATRASLASAGHLVRLFDFTQESLPAGLSFSRASSATDLQNGTLATFAANTPKQGLSGILLEQQRTNLLTLSQNVTIAPWTTNGTVTRNADVYIAPDGSTTADQLVTTTHSWDGLCYRPSITAGVTYTVSVFVKAINATRIRFGSDSPSWGSGTQTAYVDFDLESNTGSPISSAVIAYTITDAGNGWKRVTVTATSAITTSSAAFIIYSGTGTSQTLALWGAQIEAGAGATSHIPTTGASATRAADDLSIISPEEIPASNGRFTLKVRTAPFHDGSTQTQTLLAFGNAAERIILAKNTSRHLVVTSSGFTNGIALDAGAIGENAEIVTSLAWNATGWKLTIGETTFSGIGDRFSATPSIARIGSSSDGNWWNGYIKSLSLHATS